MRISAAVAAMAFSMAVAAPIEERQDAPPSNVETPDNQNWGWPWPKPTGWPEPPKPTGWPWPEPTGWPKPSPTWPEPSWPTQSVHHHPWKRAVPEDELEAPEAQVEARGEESPETWPSGWPEPTWPEPTGWPKPTGWPEPPKPTGWPWPEPTGWPKPPTPTWPNPWPTQSVHHKPWKRHVEEREPEAAAYDGAALEVLEA